MFSEDFAGYKFHKYPLYPLYSLVFFCEAFVDHNSVLENAVFEAAENNRDDFTWVRSASYQQNHGSASVMFQRQIWKYICAYLCYLFAPGEKPNSRRDHVECCECWLAMLCLLWIYATGRWSYYGCLVGGMTVWLLERFRTQAIVANMVKVAPQRFESLAGKSILW